MTLDEHALTSDVAELEACNQRGDRMLTILDLIDAGSVDLSMAAYLAAAMRSGASLLVGAQAGGAGKTAVMCALLAFLPNETRIVAVDHPRVLERARRNPQPGRVCYLAHEISDARHYAYIWGRSARRFFGLLAQRQIIAATIHADTLEQAREQLTGESGVDATHLAAVGLKLFLRVDKAGNGEVRRSVNTVYEGSPSGEHLMFRQDADGTFSRGESGRSLLVSGADESAHERLIADMRERGINTIREMRAQLLGT